MHELTEAERVREALVRCKDHRDEIAAERDRYRAALVRIADAESGRWGWIAYDALHPEREPHDSYGGSDGGD